MTLDCALFLKAVLFGDEHIDSRESSSTLSICLALALGVFLLLIWRILEDMLMEFSLSDEPIEDGINFNVGT